MNSTTINIQKTPITELYTKWQEAITERDQLRQRVRELEEQLNSVAVSPVLSTDAMYAEPSKPENVVHSYFDRGVAVCGEGGLDAKMTILGDVTCPACLFKMNRSNSQRPVELRPGRWKECQGVREKILLHQVEGGFMFADTPGISEIKYIPNEVLIEGLLLVDSRWLNVADGSEERK